MKKQTVFFILCGIFQATSCMMIPKKVKTPIDSVQITNDSGETISLIVGFKYKVKVVSLKLFGPPTPTPKSIFDGHYELFSHNITLKKDEITTIKPPKETVFLGNIGPENAFGILRIEITDQEDPESEFSSLINQTLSTNPEIKICKGLSNKRIN